MEFRKLSLNEIIEARLIELKQLEKEFEIETREKKLTYFDRYCHQHYISGKIDAYKEIKEKVKGE